MFLYGTLYRKLHRNGGALGGAALHPNTAAVEIGDLPHQRKPQPHPAVGPTAGLVHPEEGVENTPMKFRRDAVSGIGNPDLKMAFSVRLNSSR